MKTWSPGNSQSLKKLFREKLPPVEIFFDTDVSFFNGDASADGRLERFFGISIFRSLFLDCEHL